MLIHHTSQKLIMISRNHYILKTMISRNHYIMFLPIFHAISWVFGVFRGTKKPGAVHFMYMKSIYDFMVFMISHMISYILAIISLHDIHI